MSGDQRRHAGLTYQGKQLPEYGVCRRRVEIAGRLVGQKHPRRIGHRASNGDALLLSARQPPWPMVGAILELDHGEQIDRSPARFAA